MTLKSSFDNLLQSYGFDTTLERPVFSGPNLSVTVRVMRRYAEEEKLIHEVSQDTTWFMVRRDELDDASFPVPLKKGDRILDDGAWYTTYVVEPVRDGPNVIGYKCRTIGD